MRPQIGLPERMQHHIGCSYLTFSHNVFNIYPQMDSPRVANVATIITFVKTFPTFCFDTSPRITYLNRYIIAPVVFV